MFDKDTASITLTIRQLSILTAGFVFFSFFVFIAGYFLGKKRTAEEFYYRADQESLADQIYSSMCVLYDVKDEGDELNSENSEELAQNSEETSEEEQKEKEEPVAIKKGYHATVAGFSSSGLADAKKLVNQLTSSGFPAQVVQRESKAKGKTVTWYQVITKAYDSYDEIEAVRPKIAKLAHVSQKSIRIDECLN